MVINQASTVLQTLVIALGAGLAVWGVVPSLVSSLPLRFVPRADFHDHRENNLHDMELGCSSSGFSRRLWRSIS